MNPGKKFEIGRRFVVFPFYDGQADADPGDRIPIFIGPGRAFGSGEHETTASCLEELEVMDGLVGSTVLDLGCGTGILAIGAANLGARRVIAVDPEPDSVEASRANARMNGVKSVVEAIQGDIAAVKGRRFDIIMANIYGDVLLSIAPDTPLFLNPSGRLLLSGIHYDYAYEVKKAYTDIEFRIIRARALENYCTLVLGK